MDVFDILMYVFSIMKLEEMIGVNVFTCVKRLNTKTYYVSNDTAKSSGKSYSLIIPVNGKIRFVFRDSQFVVGKGDVICFPPNALMESQMDQSQNASYLIVNFMAIGRSGERLEILDNQKVFCRKLSDVSKVTALFAKLIKAYDSSSIAKNGICSTYAMQMLRLLSTETSDEIAISDGDFSINHIKIKRAIETIYRNYKKVIDVSELAKAACMHPASFSRLFKSQTKLSPRQYILHFKIRKAKDFIHLYDTPLQYTAAELGFNDYSHFFRTFTRIAGMTPLEYSRTCKQG